MFCTYANMFQLELPYIPYLALYLISAGMLSSHTKCTTHWRLEHGGEVINPIVGEEESILDKDPLFRILAEPLGSSINEKQNTSIDILNIESGTSNEPKAEAGAIIPAPQPAYERFKTTALTCGEPVNETAIDHLEGIIERFLHPTYPEPDVALLFRENEFDNVPVSVIEVNLLDAMKSGENRLILFNQIGNFLRIKGDTYHAIECFRSAILIAHNNVDVLLNLARMLLNLNYIKDAIYLAERSLDQQSPEQSTWLQHFTLGEILERNGELDRALSHFQMALDQNPSFHPAQINMKNLGNTPVPAMSNVYTFCIMTVLCFLIMLYLYFTIIKEPQEPNNNYNYKRSGFFKHSKSLT